MPDRARNAKWLARRGENFLAPTLQGSRLGDQEIWDFQSADLELLETIV
jgi:hypothetical protein